MDGFVSPEIHLVHPSLTDITCPASDSWLQSNSVSNNMCLDVGSNSDNSTGGFVTETHGIFDDKVSNSAMLVVVNWRVWS